MAQYFLALFCFILKQTETNNFALIEVVKVISQADLSMILLVWSSHKAAKIAIILCPSLYQSPFCSVTLQLFPPMAGLFPHMLGQAWPWNLLWPVEWGRNSILSTFGCSCSGFLSAVPWEAAWASLLGQSWLLSQQRTYERLQSRSAKQLPDHPQWSSGAQWAPPWPQ